MLTIAEGATQNGHGLRLLPAVRPRVPVSLTNPIRTGEATIFDVRTKTAIREACAAYAAKNGGDIPDTEGGRGVAGDDTWRPDEWPTTANVVTEPKTKPTWLAEYERWLFGWLKRVKAQRDPTSLYLPMETN